MITVLVPTGHYMSGWARLSILTVSPRCALAVVCEFAELMLLGFISLTLTVTQYYIVDICLPSKVLQKWTPCSPTHPHSGTSCAADTYNEVAGTKARRLLEYGVSGHPYERMLAGEKAGEKKDACQGNCKAGVSSHSLTMCGAASASTLSILLFLVLFVCHVFVLGAQACCS